MRRRFVISLKPSHLAIVGALLLWCAPQAFSDEDLVRPQGQACPANTTHPVHLSFDDGPKDPETAIILDTLKRRGIKATFFISTHRFPNLVDANRPLTLHEKRLRALVERMRAEGHKIGNHFHEHISLVDADRAANEVELNIANSAKVLEGLGLQTKEMPFRFPFGRGWLTERNSKRRLEAKKLIEKMKTMSSHPMHWDAAAYEWNKLTRKALPQLMLNEICENRGGVVLLHDIHPFVARNLDPLIDSIQMSGHQIVSYQQIVSANEKNPGAWMSFRDSRDLLPETNRPSSKSNSKAGAAKP